SLKCEHGEMVARSKDFGKRVDFFRINFTVREGFDPDELRNKLNALNIPNQVAQTDGMCGVTLPAFEWGQIKQLHPVDGVIEGFTKESLRSRSWHVGIKAFKRIDFNINVLIEQMMENKGSDIHMRAGCPPYMRIDSELKPLDLPPMSADDMQEVVFQLGGQAEVDYLMTEKESSFQYHLAGIGFLRCSGYVKMGAMALAIRFIPEEPYPFEKLDLPPQVRDVA